MPTFTPAAGSTEALDSLIEKFRSMKNAATTGVTSTDGFANAMRALSKAEPAGSLYDKPTVTSDDLGSW